MEEANYAFTAIVLAALAWGVYRVFFSGERVGRVTGQLLGRTGRLGITVSRVAPEAGREHRVRLRFGIMMGAKSQTWMPEEAIELAQALERGAALVDRRAAP